MLAARSQFALLLLLGLLGLSGTAHATATRHPKPKVPANQEEAAAQPTAPSAPLTPAQMPATPPQVAFNNGSLTIVAQNSTLGDILRAVHTQTGAVMEISGNATERVMSRFGPGTPRDVLAQLLNGSHFNYVILGSPADAGMVQRVILTPKAAGDQETEAQSTPAAGAPAGLARPAQQMTEDESDDASDSDTQDDQATAAPGSDQPPGGTPASQPTVKTPEQLLQELQRQQQLQQQQQQGDNPSPPGQR